LSRQRGPASQAVLLYEETIASVQKRGALADQLRLQALTTPHPARRPNKKDRRHIIRFTQPGD
jgi:ribosome-associated heat shock protein Hsp15